MMFRKMANGVMRFRWPLALALALITLIFCGFILSLQIDPTTDTLFNKESRAYKEYREFSVKFGSDQMVAVAMQAPDLFSMRQLLFLKELTTRLAGLPQVERVLSLANVMDIRPRFIGVKVAPVLEKVYRDSAGDEDVKKARKRILNNELYLNNLVSKDGTVANILIYLKAEKVRGSSSGSFIQLLLQTLDKAEKGRRKFYVAGAPVEQYEFVRLIRRDQFIFVPMITLLLILSTWVIYRSFSCMLLAMGIVFMTLTWSMGTIALLGDQLNLVTSLLAPVIMIVATSNSIHVMNLFFYIRSTHASFREAVMQTMNELGIPSLLSHFTIVVGFFSLVSSPVPAIRNFGIYAGLGAIYCYIISMMGLPILLSLLPFRPKVAQVENEHAMNRVLVSFIERIQFYGKWWILAGTILLCVFSYVGIKRIRVDTGLIQQMKPESKLAQATRFIDSHLTGVYSLGFVFERKDGGTFNDPVILKKIDDFKSFLEENPVIAKVNSLTTLVKKINQAREGGDEGYEIPNDPVRVKLYFRKMTKNGDSDLWKMISRDLRQIRLEARMRAVGTQEGTQLEDKAIAYLKEHLGRDCVFHLTGNVVLLGHMAKSLVYAQVNGFFYAYFSILFIITLFFRSFKMGLLASIPNLLPVFFIYGIMGFLQIDLSTATAMISSIVIGMMVDASIHFMYRFRLEFERRQNYLQAMHHTFRRTGLSLTISTIILSAGFGTSVFASFKPTVYLGIFTGLSIIFSLICTLLILPMMLIFFKPFGQQKSFSG